MSNVEDMTDEAKKEFDKELKKALKGLDKNIKIKGSVLIPVDRCTQRS
ncbi:MAG: hypothetical protein LKE61_09195 [Erysipelotrichaceae bacterium]|nr:hypothetical protein [Erysipelotrichaceae bacterium]MCH4043970.1 hypothetical protein [Erysipelotrichaceae bacterium]MCH4121185.1 hypothetical protein [Erysipelotrichaceae bacterium]